jgi:hypothetical protein
MYLRVLEAKLSDAKQLWSQLFKVHSGGPFFDVGPELFPNSLPQPFSQVPDVTLRRPYLAGEANGQDEIIFEP